MAEKDKSKTIDMKILKEGSSVNIKISYNLYSRIQNLLMVGIPFQDIESAHKVLLSVKASDKDPDPVTYHTRTLLTLISLVEEAAEKEDKIETKTINLATGKPV